MKPFEIRVDNDIVLRLRKEKDAKELFDLIDRNRSFFKKSLGWLDFNQNVNDSLKFIQDCLINYTNGTALNLAIIYKNKVVGSIGFNTINQLNKSAEIGYMLDKEFNGMGIMVRSCKSLINYGFQDLGLNRIVIKTGTTNTKSSVIPQKFGFEKEGILRQSEFLYNHFVDLEVYAMLKENWK